MLGSQAAFCKGRPHFVLVEGWKFIPDFIDAGGGVFAFDFLLEISDLEIFSQLTASAQRWNQPEDAL